jgi:hypothetical protein
MNIKELVQTFSDHEIEAEEVNQANLIAFVQDNPGQEIPEYMKGDFNFARAMRFICQEIVLIKEKLGME